MPFVAQIKERVEKAGIGPGLKQALDFDEKDILIQNQSYLLSNLDLERIEIKCSEEGSEDRIKDDCVPGEPYITFASGLSRTLFLANQQPRSAHHSGCIILIDGDEVRQLKSRMVSTRLAKSTAAVELFRYKDPDLGPRKIPDAKILESGDLLCKLEDSDVISFGEDDTTFVTTKEAKVELGTHAVYRIISTK